VLLLPILRIVPMLPRGGAALGQRSTSL